MRVVVAKEGDNSPHAICACALFPLESRGKDGQREGRKMAADTPTKQRARVPLETSHPSKRIEAS